MNDSTKYSCSWGVASLGLGLVCAALILGIIGLFFYSYFVLQSPIDIDHKWSVMIITLVILGFSGNLTGLLLGSISLIRLNGKPVSKKISKLGLIINSMFLFPVMLVSIIALMIV